ncbi:SDR family NAD(P)-dependent oxidoreductase [Dictyobacter aurantiacus]|uniref:Dehydrogenase n=1 Tax=Dictyobacter aurantiacus TaxID=1936993 RepID=A0A401ZN60_9CHLR|nr:SDR family oxidoreductase [Dictyobacter aurantiacus]GCE08301.1 dehydrogenase [Dictyobacter aurantiacus]
MGVQQRVALVTGATSGIGAGIARRFGECGARVAVAGRNVERGMEVVESIQQMGAQAMFVEHELEDDLAPVRVISEVEASLGPIEILVHSAAWSVFKATTDVTPDLFDQIFQRNVKGLYFLTAAALPGMIRRRHGRVVLISSIAALRGVGGQSLYCASKAALDQLARAWVTEYARYGINFNTVAPGMVATPMTAELTSDPQLVAAVKAATPDGRLGTPDDIARAVLFLSDDNALHIQGNTIVVDGGWIVPPGGFA